MERVDLGYGRFAVLRALRYVLWTLPALVGFGVQRLFTGSPELVENLLSRGLFRLLSSLIATVDSLIPFSLTELLAVLAIPLFLLLVFLFVRKIRRAERYTRGHIAGRTFHRLLWALSIAYLMFMMLHGWNYARLPVAATFDLPVAARSAKDLASASLWLARHASEARSEVQEDANGVMRLAAGVGGTLKAAGTAYKITAETYPLLAGPEIRPKGVILSRFWSYTGITGMYFPFFVEANINIDVPQCSLTDTLLHEIAHTRGFAREDEAGFMAFLTGIHHPSADFRYGAYLEAFLSLSGQLYAYDTDAWTASWSAVSDGIRRDLTAQSDYWKQFEGPVLEVSEQVNNAYLQANLQKDGVYSYGRKTDLILAYLYGKDPGAAALAGGTP